MFKKAVEWDLLKSNPATSVKRFSVTSERTRFLTQDEIKRLLEECEKQVTSPWLLPLVTLALNTGMRQGHLLKLKWENIDVDRGSITIIQGKTLRRKTLRLTNWQRARWNGSKRTVTVTFSSCGLGRIRSARLPSTMPSKEPAARQESTISASMT